MSLNSIPSGNEGSKTTKSNARASHALDVGLAAAIGVSVGGIAADLTKNNVPEKEQMTIASETIDHQLTEHEAGELVFMLDEVFRAGGPRTDRNAEMVLLRYLESGPRKDVDKAVMRYSSPEQERKQAIARLGEAVLALSRYKQNGEQIDERVGQLLSRVSLQFAEGMRALAGQRLKETSPLSPGAPSDSYDDAGSDTFTDESGERDI